MAEYDRETVRCKNCIHNEVCFYREMTNDIDEWLDEFGCEYYKPTADVVEVRHGVWLPIEIEEWFYSCVDKRTVYKCSLCGRYEDKQEPYCNCGAKMDGGA